MKLNSSRHSATLALVLLAASVLGSSVVGCFDSRSRGRSSGPVAEPDASTGTDTAQPGTDTAQPGTDTAQPGTDTAQDTNSVPDGLDPDCWLEPTLSSLQADYFQPQCVMCHGPNAGSFGNLDLRADGLHSRLVGVLANNQSARSAGKRLVLAGDAESSFLYQKIHGSHDLRTEGGLMPPSVFEPFDPGCRIYMLKKWMDDGALNN